MALVKESLTIMTTTPKYVHSIIIRFWLHLCFYMSLIYNRFELGNSLKIVYKTGRCQYLSSAVLVTFAILICSGCSGNNGTTKKDSNVSRTIIDIRGVTVKIPVVVKRISCVDVLSYSIMITLGEADKVVSMQINAGRAPWVDRVRPPTGIILLESTPVIEELLRQKIDVLIGGYGG